MKTGRLIKLHRPGGDVHICLYLEPDAARAVLYRFTGGEGDREPAHELRGRSAQEVEAAARAWVDEHFPRER